MAICFYVDKGQKNKNMMMLMGDSVGIDYNHDQGLEFCLMDVLQNKQSFPNVS